jgi:hypothetical protein
MINAVYRTVMKSSVHANEVHHGVNRRRIKISKWRWKNEVSQVGKFLKVIMLISF